MPELRGLYVITRHETRPERLIPDVAAAIQGGARLVQYRDKSGDTDKRAWEAQDLLTLCRPLGVPLLINDDTELARRIGADGVHLGIGDGGIAQARRRLGPRAIIGATCHDSLERALQAQGDGASYVAFGRFFPSSSKPQASPASPALLTEARSRLRLPVVAIGGITPDNGARLVDAGADMLAVIGSVFDQPDITAAARCLARLYA